MNVTHFVVTLTHQVFTLRACCAAFLVSATVYMIHNKGQYVTLVVKSLSLQVSFQDVLLT